MKMSSYIYIAGPNSQKKLGAVNDVSDPEDELTDSQKTSKLSEIYSTTIPSVDSAMESWDGSGIDAGYGSQGETASIVTGLWRCTLNIRVLYSFQWAVQHPSRAFPGNKLQ